MSLLAAWTLCLASILAAIWLGDNEHFFDAYVLGAPVTFIIGALWAMRFAFAWACSWVDSLPSPPPPPEPPTNRRARRDSVFRPPPPQPPPVLEQDAAWQVRSKTGSPPVPRSSSPSPSPRPWSDLDLAVQRFIFGGPSYGPVIPVTSCPFGIRPARSARPEFPVSRQEGPKKTAVVFSERQLRFWADIQASAPRIIDVLEDASRPQWSPPSNEGAYSEGLQSHVRSSAPPAVSLSPPAPSPPAMPLKQKSTQLAETQRALDLAAPEVAPTAPSLVGRVYPPNTWVKDNRSEELFCERTRWHYDMTTRWCLQGYSDQFEKLVAAS
ncbi:hypothetical protein CC80DRAFT_541651 [Byssothecium circinans]|uniref:Uncharacterized protein n=1 Tax=Byssothecium circinans TaxID=147558 RepID=A0A6A5ULE0_9PLEO|nr:hypothetical protein CC80DRAFT_541651 [Byssothecium circinans]